jgi:hypothetical protein
MHRRLLNRLPLAALIVAAVALVGCHAPAPQPEEASASALPMLPAVDRALDFARDVKPVLDNRCAVCHGCYDAPCQLLLTSHAGAMRGASQTAVYDSSRLVNAAPTRLFIDAHGAEAWRAKGFFPVSDGKDALLLRMLALGKAHPFEAGKRLPASVGLDVNRELTCATGEEFPDYARKHPLGGMPYGTAPLSDAELGVLAAWIAQGSPASAPAPLATEVAAQVAIWETFLNGESLKEKVTGRYLYEHWFVADLYFENLPQSPFLRIVRSRTPPGQPIDEISTVRPYDDPGTKAFWYRLQPLQSSIVHKTHIVYPLGPAKLARLKALFVEAAWTATRLPGYAPRQASNPFVTFAEIPPRSRYQYMLDDAQYFVMTFIRGPVCRGQIAVDVIEDRFFVSFIDPDHDLSITDPTFLAQTQELLSLPAEYQGSLVPGSVYLAFARDQHRYLAAREQRYNAIDPENRGPALDWVWDGDGTNTNALLTVFRNFDNATVRRGWVGGMPKTAWVMDYPIFERIYYDLVAGFDVFGNLVHQVSTRLYMDHLRMQSENLFLTLLPSESRESLRASWYVGATRQLNYFYADDLRGLKHGTQVRYGPGAPMPQLIEQILARNPVVSGPSDTLNRCAKPPCERAGATPVERAIETELQRLASVKGAWVAPLPQVSLLRVRVDASGRNDLVYSLVHNDSHANVAFMFGEDDRRIPADDTVTVVRGHFGSYPNFFFAVDAAEIAAFVDGMKAIRGDADLERFVDVYGIRRTDARFWATSDWLREDLIRAHPVEAGIYDLGRYGNP